MIREILFPEGALCLCCGTVSGGELLCPVCRLLLEDSAFEPDMQKMNAYHGDNWSVWPHKGQARRLVHLLKYENVACCAEILGKPMASLAGRIAPEDDITVTWVTMPRKRFRERGIDHGRLLAEIVAKENGWPVRRLLDRDDRHLITQQGLNYQRRMKNLSGCFRAGGRVSGAVLLVDDVLTTGATTNLCRRLLTEAGAESVTVLTATRA